MKNALEWKVIMAGLALTALTTSSKSSECDLKTMVDINWNRLAGTTWYQMLNTRDAVVNVSPCFIIRFHEATDDGIKFEFIMLDPSYPNDVSIVLQEFYKTESGYRLRKANENEFMDASISQAIAHSSGELVNDIKDVIDHFENTRQFFTDYESYFIGIRCGEDSQYVYAYSSYNGISAKLTSQIYNTMIQHDSRAVPLYFAKCNQIENIEKYFNLSNEK
ncbi:uncharacterized protein LOC144429803 [Styela clava]